MHPDDHIDEPTRVMHRRLSVALASGSERARVVEALTAADLDAVIDLTPRSAVTQQDLFGAASQLGAERSAARRAEQRRLEHELSGSLERRDAAASRRDEIAERGRRLREGVEWCEALAAQLPDLRQAVEDARADLDARRGEQRDAQSRLDRVLEQRAEAEAATESASRELQGLDGAHLDETGLRRELEAANSIVHQAVEAHEQAVARLGEQEAVLSGLHEDMAALAEERRQLAASLGQEPADTSAVRAALSAFEEAEAFAHPDGRAADLVLLLSEIGADLETAQADLPPGPDPAELATAREALTAAQTAFAEAETTARQATLSPEQRADLDAAHDAITDAEDRARGRGAVRRVEEARQAEADLLAQHGFATYLEVVLTGGRPTEVALACAAAEQALRTAAERVTALEAVATEPAELTHLRQEHDRLRSEAAALLRVDPGDQAVQLLKGLRNVPSDVTDGLVAELERVGVRPRGVRLETAATTWLQQQDELAEARRGGTERLASLDARREELGAQQIEAEAGVAATAEGVRRAAAAETDARRGVTALEAELTARAGEDVRRLQRVAAAEQLRAQVEALRTALASAETEGRAALDAAVGLAAVAEATLDRAESTLMDSARQVRRWVEILPGGLRIDPGANPLGAAQELAGALDEAAERNVDDLAAAETAVAAATTQAEEASAGLALARGEADGSPRPDDLADALERLLTEPARGSASVLDDPLAGMSGPLRDRLLDVVLSTSTQRPIVLLTEDPVVLGWAIGLPPEAGAVVPVDALVALAGGVTHPTPVPGHRRRGAS